jgi:hypothetical protein
MKKIIFAVIISLALSTMAFPQDPVVGTWRGTHTFDPTLGGGTGSTVDLHFFDLGTFGVNQGDFTLNAEASSTILTQGAWNRKQSSGRKRNRNIRVGATEVDGMDPNETYLLPKFRVKGTGLDKFVADFVNTGVGTPPTAQLSGRISGDKISSSPVMGVVIETSETASGM